MYKSRLGQNKREGYRARKDRAEHDGVKRELSRAHDRKDHSRVERNRAAHITRKQSRGIVFWGNSSCHCYLTEISSGETNAKLQKVLNTQRQGLKRHLKSSLERTTKLCSLKKSTHNPQI